jgi:hypothetical protein
LLVESPALFGNGLIFVMQSKKEEAENKNNNGKIIMQSNTKRS